MSRFDLKALQEGIATRDLREEGKQLTGKWEQTGLLQGLKDTKSSRNRTNMARLLENQAASLMRESSEV